MTIIPYNVAITIIVSTGKDNVLSSNKISNLYIAQVYRLVISYTCNAERSKRENTL